MSRLTKRSCLVHCLSLALLAVIGVTPVRAGPVPPGAPQARIALNQAAITITEPGDPNEPIVSVTLPVQVVSGFLILLENGASKDPSNWSDVVYFHNITVGGQVTGQAQLISDAPGAIGITDNDLKPLGLTVASVQGSLNPQYLPEVDLGSLGRADLAGNFGAIYPAPNANLPPGPPGTTATLTYTVISDPVPEPSSLLMGCTGTLLSLTYWLRRRHRCTITT